jgi:hypothetical protein
LIDMDGLIMDVGLGESVVQPLVASESLRAVED